MNKYGRQNMVININTRYAKHKRIKSMITKLMKGSCIVIIGVAFAYMFYVASIHEIGYITFTQCMLRMMLAIMVMILSALIHDIIENREDRM